MEFTFTCEQLVDSFTKRYIEDIGNQTYSEVFAIFDLIMKEYKEANKCPICTDGDGLYKYNQIRITCGNRIFYVGNDVISFAIKANYCPICGKNIGEED